MTLLLDNSGSIVVMNTSTTNSINSSNSSLNGITGGISPPINRNGYNKRNSMDSTLNSSSSSNSQVPINRVLNQSISESPQKHQNQQQNNHDLAAPLAHRRSLSEHVIMSSMPADKARCHLLNRTNSKLNQDQNTSPPSSPTIPTYSNVTLRKVAETMFLKDPQYKPRPKEDSKLNPFAALTQLRGVKKILGANASNLSPGSTDLFSSCFEIMSSPFLKSLKELNSKNQNGDQLGVGSQQQQQPKSLPTSPISSRRFSDALTLTVPSLDSTSHKKCFDKLQNHPLYKSCKHETELNHEVEQSEASSVLPTITTTITSSASHSYTKLVDKIEPMPVEVTPPPITSLGCANSSFYETSRMLTRRGSTESGFFSCLNEDFCDKTRDLDLTNPYFCTCCPIPSTPASKKENVSNDSSSVSLRSLDDLELSDPRQYHRMQSCPHRTIDIDARSIDMGLINRLALDTEINSLIQKHQLSNQLFHCKNRTSSIYSDSSDSLAGSDSLLWDDRSYQIPNTRSAQIAKIVEYFERKGASHFKPPTFAVPEIKPSTSPSAATRNYLPTSNYHHHKQLTDYFVDLRRDFDDISSGGSSSSGYGGFARHHRDYEAFCFELAEKKNPQNFHKICEGLVKSKLQLFDKQKQNGAGCSNNSSNNATPEK